jgi:hypothetical protein
VKNFTNNCIWNADESGFLQELHLDRTLDSQGVKRVEAAVQSVGATTHSYTIMPVISMAGDLAPKLLVILKEVQKPSANVWRKMFKSDNLYIATSKSGKIDTQIMLDFIKNLFLPNSGARNLLLLDSCSSHKSSIWEDVVTQSGYEEEKLEIAYIPAGCTDELQPLDVYFFRAYKAVCKHLSNQSINSDSAIKMAQRDNILKLQALMYHQVCSPRFLNARVYAWFKSGYCERPEKFIGMTEYLIHNLMVCCSCSNPAALRCAYCKNMLCFKHFFIDYHFCTDYII